MACVIAPRTMKSLCIIALSSVLLALTPVIAQADDGAAAPSQPLGAMSLTTSDVYVSPINLSIIFDKYVNEYEAEEMNLSVLDYDYRYDDEYDEEYYYYIADKTYTGKPIRPTITVNYLGGDSSDDDYWDDEDSSDYGPVRLQAGVDYTVSYANNIKPGKATVTVKGINKYSGTISKTFRIRGNLASAKIAGVKKKYNYTGNYIKPVPTVTFAGERLQQGKHYKVRYFDAVGAGTATLRIEGKGFYKGKASIDYEIVKRRFANARIAKIKPQSFTGNPVKPKPVVKYGKKTLKLNRDYRVTYKNNKSSGMAVAVIQGKGLYQGALKKKFRIIGDVSKARVAPIRFRISNGRAITPVPTVKLGSTQLKYGRDYKTLYSNNVNAGVARIAIVGKGKYYRGMKTATFSIIQRGTDPTVTFAEFSRIRMGMTYGEVAAIIGGNGKLVSASQGSGYSYKSYEWPSAATSWGSAFISFDDNEVNYKSQSGL